MSTNGIGSTSSTPQPAGKPSVLDRTKVQLRKGVTAAKENGPGIASALASYASSQSRNPQDPNTGDTSPHEQMFNYLKSQRRQPVENQSMDQLLGSPLDAPPNYASINSLQANSPFGNGFAHEFAPSLPQGLPQYPQPPSYLQSTMPQFGTNFQSPFAPSLPQGLPQYPSTQFTNNQFTLPNAINSANYTSLNFNANNTAIGQLMPQVTAMNIAYGSNPLFGGGMLGGGALGGIGGFGGFGGGYGAIDTTPHAMY